MRISKGVSEYTTAIVSIPFAKGEERCKYCPMFQTYSRPYCQRTGELIVDALGRGKLKLRKKYGESNGDKK